MKQGWDPKTIDLAFNATQSDKQKLLLEQITEILYSYFCQLERESISGSLATETASSELRRTH